MKIAFITTHIKTRLFYGVAQRLEAAGHEVYWLSVSRTWTLWLQERGVSPDRILDITAFGPEWTAQPELTNEELSELQELEVANGWTIKNLILMDRLLARKPYAHALAYLSVCQRELRRFLSTKNIQTVFLEATWAFELITIQVCRLLKIPIYAPHTPRIPDGRFIFFDGQMQTNFARIRAPRDEDREEAKTFYEHFHAKKPKPAYFHRNNKIPAFKAEWVRKLFFHREFAREDPYNETRFPISMMIKRRLLEVFNTRRTMAADLFVSPALPPKRPFVLMTLHKQPESSIDVLGPSTSNQLELIVALTRSLPATHDLYVKEHSNAIGDRAANFYHRVNSLPGVVLVDPFMDSYSLLEHASLVVTVSGTIAYESALLGVPAMTLSPMFFDPLVALSGATPFANYSKTIQDFLIQQPSERRHTDSDERIEFLADILANSFPGIISDPDSDPRCMEEDNLDRVAEGVLTLIKGLGRTD